MGGTTPGLPGTEMPGGWVFTITIFKIFIFVIIVKKVRQLAKLTVALNKFGRVNMFGPGTICRCFHKAE